MNNTNPYKQIKRRRKVKAGKFFILFVFCCFFTSLVLLASVLSNVLSISNWGLFNTVSVEANTMYCVCYGEYETENSATIQSEYIKTKGGAGLIYKNGETYTILLSGYLDKQTCQNVYDKNIENFDKLHQVTISLSSNDIQHTKSTKNITSLENIVNLPLTTFKTLQEICNSLDGGHCTSHQAYNQLFNLAYNINNVIQDFENSSMLTSKQDYDNLLLTAKNIYSKINSLILNTAKSDLSWKIKYYGLDIILLAS